MRRKVTFAEWGKRGDARPVQYPSISCGVIEAARRCGSVFARKFTAETCPPGEWERAVEHSEQQVTFTPPDSNAGNSVRQYGAMALSSSRDNGDKKTSDSNSAFKRRKLDDR